MEKYLVGQAAASSSGFRRSRGRSWKSGQDLRHLQCQKHGGKDWEAKHGGERAKAKGRGLSDRSSDSQSDSHSACGHQSWLEVQIPPMSNITNHQVAGHIGRTKRERCAVEVDNELMVLLNSIERCLRLF